MNDSKTDTVKKVAALLLGLTFGMLWAVAIIDQESQEARHGAVR